MELTIGHEPAFSVSPLGLVLEAGTWHLVVVGEGGAAVVCLGEPRAHRLTTQVFVRPVGNDLAEFWTRRIPHQIVTSG
jgi:hypothetical protein